MGGGCVYIRLPRLVHCAGTLCRDVGHKGALPGGCLRDPPHAQNPNTEATCSILGHNNNRQPITTYPGSTEPKMEHPTAGQGLMLLDGVPSTQPQPSKDEAELGEREAPR